MGNSQAQPTSNPRFSAASRSFTDKELEDLRTLFVSLAAQSRSDGRFVAPDVFESFFRIPGALGDRMFDLITQGRRDARLTFEDLVVAKGTYEKGAREEVEEFVYSLCDVDGDGIVARSDLEVVFSRLLIAIFPSKNIDCVLATDKSIIHVFVDAATFSKESDGNIEFVSFENFKKWYALLPSVWKFLGNLLSHPTPGRSGFQVPFLQHPDIIHPDMLVLKKEYAWHIGGVLSQHEVVVWELLYHSAIHGFSFATFLGNISNSDGPTVLIIKDQEEQVYGGYASQPWVKHGDFYGDMKTFLFQLYPKASIFRPTGLNANLQWCAVNFTSDRIPNGIGFGGKASHFGLFLSSSFEEGHTYSCTTFDSPCLSKRSNVQPQVIECWGISTKEASEGKVQLGKGTILDRFKEDHNMLKMLGIANSTE